MRRQKWLFCRFAEGRAVFGCIFFHSQKRTTCKCAIAGRLKIELKKLCGGENKKYNRVSSVSRSSPCPVKILSVCPCPSVKWFLFFQLSVRYCHPCLCLFTLAANVLAVCDVPPLAGWHHHGLLCVVFYSILPNNVYFTHFFYAVSRM